MESIRICTGTLAALGAPAIGGMSSSPEGCSLDIGPLALKRRVSFNLDGNSVLHLPSNTAITKISQARLRRNSSSAGSAEGAGDQGLAELAKQADRRAQALLPHGASLELLDSHCPMTALCVKRGHICAMNSDRLEPGSGEIGQLAQLLAPPKGVLKPFAPSPVNAELLAGSFPEEAPERPGATDEALTADAVVPGADGAAAEDQRAPDSAAHSAGRTAKRPASKKKKSQFKRRHQRQAPDGT
ncbi:hypothetical protein IWQ56_005352, partial [Coemansia nantahalensis]